MIVVKSNEAEEKHVVKHKMGRLDKIYTGHIWADTRTCEACWKCLDVCPQQVIGRQVFLWHKHVVFKKPEECLGCGKCVRVCPNGVFSRSIPEMLKGYLEKKRFRLDPSGKPS